jgi:hypothetical protein
MIQTSKILFLSKATSDKGGLFFSRFAPALRVRSNAVQKQKQLAYKRLHTTYGMRRCLCRGRARAKREKKSEAREKSPAIAISALLEAQLICHLVSCEVNRSALKRIRARSLHLAVIAGQTKCLA